jgi:hypothetical protein
VPYGARVVRARTVSLVIGVAVFGAFGPRLTHPHDKRAGEPFSYQPPEGFTATTASLEEKTQQVWTHKASGAAAFVARVSLVHSSSRGTVEESDLVPIVEGLPATAADEGITWTHRRHETRARVDGARVGVIEGDCVKKVEGFAGLVTETKFRRLQLAFPDDQGTSIVTAQFAEEEASRWEPAFEATIGAARGVATRLPSPPAWMFAAWGSAGFVLAWLVNGLLASRAKAKDPT